MAVIRIVKSFSRNLCPITKSFWNVCPANGFKWNGGANKLSEFVQIPRRLRSPCPAGVTRGLMGGSDHPSFSSLSSVKSPNFLLLGECDLRVGVGECSHGREPQMLQNTLTGVMQQGLSRESFILAIRCKAPYLSINEPVANL